MQQRATAAVPAPSTHHFLIPPNFDPYPPLYSRMPSLVLSRALPCTLTSAPFTLLLLDNPSLFFLNKLQSLSDTPKIDTSHNKLRVVFLPGTSEEFVLIIRFSDSYSADALFPGIL